MKIKDEIQALLRQIVIKRDGGCVLRYIPEAGTCGGYKKDGNLIFQAEHLISRSHNVSFADLRNIVCLCKYHHGYWKPQNSRLYWELIEKIVGEERWAWIKKTEADKKPYKMNWILIQLALKQELNKMIK